MSHLLSSYGCINPEEDNFFPTNKNIHLINSNSPHWSVSKLNVKTLPCISFIMQFTTTEHTTVNSTQPSYITAPRDPLLSKLAFPQSQPDSENDADSDKKRSCLCSPYSYETLVLKCASSLQLALDKKRGK